jgi:hypothetical protein
MPTAFAYGDGVIVESVIVRFPILEVPLVAHPDPIAAP